MYTLQHVTIPEDAAEFDLPPIELDRAGDVAGTVVDEQGQPIPGAVILAAWPVDEGPNRRGWRKATALSGLDGRFRVRGAIEGAEAELTAVRGPLRTPKPVTARVGDPEPARLVLDSSQSAALSGRVVDEQGRPLAGARVHLRELRRYESGQVEGDDLVVFERGPILVTDAEGRFTTPAELDRAGEYAAYAESPGLRPARTPWTAAAEGVFPELALVAE
jgi:protocatechuate 3,4-dioxygenase beta subunit